MSEQALGGGAFVRLDVPEIPAEGDALPVAGYTELYGPGAIYKMTIVDESIARAAAARMRVKPVTPYTVRAMALAHSPRDFFDANAQDD